MAHSGAAQLRQRLTSAAMVLAPFVYDALQARLVAAVGFEAVYMTGFGTAAARGQPDLGLLTMTEMIDNVRALGEAVRIPLICDADTGYGNPLNVRRTVRAYEAAGAAALHIEDQVWPKRCGFLLGKQVIACEEMVAKVSAACAARQNPETVIIARTDALQPHGWDETERRARAYRDAGADVIFVDGILTTSDLDVYARRLGDLPLLYNGQLESVARIAARGFRFMLHPGTLFAVFKALRAALTELRATGQIADGADAGAFAEILQVLGVSDLLAWAQKYDAR
jgi:2-methylisocitrate lyase-like PEP mutase family enzyme